MESIHWHTTKGEVIFNMVRFPRLYTHFSQAHGAWKHDPHQSAFTTRGMPPLLHLVSLHFSPLCPGCLSCTTPNALPPCLTINLLPLTNNLQSFSMSFQLIVGHCWSREVRMYVNWIRPCNLTFSPPSSRD